MVTRWRADGNIRWFGSDIIYLGAVLRFGADVIVKLTCQLITCVNWKLVHGRLQHHAFGWSECLHTGG